MLDVASPQGDATITKQLLPVLHLYGHLQLHHCLEKLEVKTGFAREKLNAYEIVQARTIHVFMLLSGSIRTIRHPLSPFSYIKAL